MGVWWVEQWLDFGTEVDADWHRVTITYTDLAAAVFAMDCLKKGCQEGQKFRLRVCYD